MSRPQTAEPPSTVMETVAYDSSAGPLLRQSNGANNARSKHDALVCREYNLLVSEATEGGRAKAGAASSGDSLGATENQEGTEGEEER